MVTFDQMKDLIILVTLTWLHLTNESFNHISYINMVTFDQMKDLIILVTLTWLHLTK